MSITKTVSIIITNSQGQILLLKRSPDKKWYPAKWDIISGKIKNGEDPEKCLKRELLEETGIENYEKMENKPPYVYQEGKNKWLIHPYYCNVNQNRIRLSAEHNAYKWIAPRKLSALNLARAAKFDLEIFYGL